MTKSRTRTTCFEFWAKESKHSDKLDVIADNKLDWETKTLWKFANIFTNLVEIFEITPNFLEWKSKFPLPYFTSLVQDLHLKCKFAHRLTSTTQNYYVQDLHLHFKCKIKMPRYNTTIMKKWSKKSQSPTLYSTKMNASCSFPIKSNNFFSSFGKRHHKRICPTYYIFMLSKPLLVEFWKENFLKGFGQ